MTYEVGMQVRVVAVPHDYCSPRIGDVLTVTKVWDHGVMATTHVGLVKHGTLGQDGYHLFFNFAAIEPVVEDMGKTLKELDVKPGDVVGFKGAGDHSWVVQEDFSVFSNQLFETIDLGEHYWKHTKGFKIISRAENTPISETGTLKELNVKPGDVVEFISCEYNPTQYFYPEEPKTVTSNNLSGAGVSVYGIYPEFDHAIWKVVSRAGEAKSQKEGDNIEVFYGFDGIGFFDVEHPCYDERLVLNHTTGTFTLERI